MERTVRSHAIAVASVVGSQAASCKHMTSILKIPPLPHTAPIVYGLTAHSRQRVPCLRGAADAFSFAGPFSVHCVRLRLSSQRLVGCDKSSTFIPQRKYAYFLLSLSANCVLSPELGRETESLEEKKKEKKNSRVAPCALRRPATGDRRPAHACVRWPKWLQRRRSNNERTHNATTQRPSSVSPAISQSVRPPTNAHWLTNRPFLPVFARFQFFRRFQTSIF